MPDIAGVPSTSMLFKANLETVYAKLIDFAGGTVNGDLRNDQCQEIPST